MTSFVLSMHLRTPLFRSHRTGLICTPFMSDTLCLEFVVKGLKTFFNILIF